MPKIKHLPAVLLSLLLLTFSMNSILYAKTNPCDADSTRNTAKIQLLLADSIIAAINSYTNKDTLCSFLSQIRKKRQMLGDHYIPVLKEYATYSHKIGYLWGEMKASDFIGLQYRYGEKYDKAYEFHLRSLELARELNDSNQMFYNYNNLGQVFRMQDNNSLAIDYFHKALDVSNAVGNLRSSSFTMNTIGATLVVQKEYDRAMTYFQKSSDIARQRNDKRTLAYNYGSVGEIFLLTNRPDSAMRYFQISRNWLLELNSSKGMGVAEHLIGQAYMALKDYERAKGKFKEAIEYHINDNSKRYQSLCNCNLAKIAGLQGNYFQALNFLKLAKEQAESINSLINLVNIYDTYAEVYKMNNDWKKAYQAQQQNYIYQEKILNEKNSNSIHALEIGFETKEKEQQIKLLQSENRLKNQRIYLFVALSVLLFSLFVIGSLLYYRNKKKNAHQKETLRQQLLRSQMNPHFLFNALGSIQNYMFKNSAKEAASYLNNFASLTRSILDHSAAETVTLSQEIDALDNYIKLEQMRLQHSFDYCLNCDEEVDAEFINVPPMLIQPFVENAIKHGLRNIKSGGKLEVIFEDQDDVLLVRICDNGIGFEGASSHTKEHKSMAMSIFKERIRLLKKAHSKKAGLHIQSELNKGTSVSINVPILN
ncbi:tetratricopeptide repeat-containing sensor histidine kinase [Plebeiibacterium marinum]|uniref:Tetratricopeptide repeat protein n=1 Tax=Plebeiibacterium marinum TaxID=2992111 RepID=A0AAE3SIX6_9BACT|nr:tetratricopeptide repeat protein [Plebeiobacterium marinum]MCW3805087.1 tetratricopeptide repeat protein [Plebeiobacterium marinum]